MPEKQRKAKKSEAESAREQQRAREEVEAELPRPPASDPATSEPTAIDATRGPRPRVEPEPE